MGHNVNYYRTAFFIITLAAFIGMLPVDGPCQRIYSWTDEDGTLHITDTPPPDTAERVNTYRVTPTGQSEEKDRGNTDLKAVDAIQDYERLVEEKTEADEKGPYYLFKDLSVLLPSPVDMFERQF